MYRTPKTPDRNRLAIANKASPGSLTEIISNKLLHDQGHIRHIVSTSRFFFLFFTISTLTSRDTKIQRERERSKMMRFIVTCLVIALSVYVAYHGLEYDHGFIRLTKRSPGNRTGVKAPEKSPFDDNDNLISLYMEDSDHSSYSLHYDFYQDSCPTAERIITKGIRELYAAKPSVAPSLIRLLFHDCFIEVRSIDYNLLISRRYCS